MRRLRKAALVLLVLAIVLTTGYYLVLRLPTFGSPAEGALLERMRASPQFHRETSRFENTPPYVSALVWSDELKAYLGDEVRAPTFPVSVVPIRAEHFEKPPAPGMRAWWLGHASVLLEIDGVRILTDPVFSERASPFQWIGPARMHPAPLPLAQWKNIDAVVISHDHFDHLDEATVRHLAQAANGGTHFYVGLGIGAHLQRWGVPAAQIHDMDWWERAEVKGVAIHCTPSRHYSGRTGMDNSTLWSSWLVQGPSHSAYFSGDTGYAGHFKAIRERLGAPQLALLKVGAYGDTWLDIHMNPEAALQAHQDLGAALLLPVHWATFNLAYHAWEAPILRTLAAAAKAPGVQVAAPRPGEPVVFGVPFENRPWYLPGLGGAAGAQKP